MFSTLLIHTCGTIGGRSTTITLKVSPSFPGAIWFRERRGEPAPKTWDSKDVSKANGTLELSLLGRIAEGRIGVTHIAKVVSSSVAVWRERHGSTSSSIPNFYGFFSSSMAEQPAFPNLEFTPWTNRKHRIEETDSPPSDIDEFPSPDWLADDVPPYPGDLPSYEDPSGYQKTSSWYRWGRPQENPTISVIVLEHLGETCTGDRARGNDVLMAVREVLEDIAEHGLIHSNVTAWNALSLRDRADIGKDRGNPRVAGHLPLPPPPKTPTPD
ncbi:protein kinase subdomain-containing protein PKL/ccin3 [Coprinopsis cinerea okayama7|uniref:Protein kinase subdomain-containing protein PKL/ccin3 n=1 Tax=Coprinopsis cinerea (strain Okayama-7 / 130 / ATCC MYA-4618 / FGSC 9003) TaxID=240176 RepID=D6RNE7_COPC7|nr:protein kinase subdomain-containing protein PKL/ccin3 [Coprinopsis cinerea okayama7\|eukprot:XP_002911075.1 protein kinase subdomain-containing protein PKL/ccin3 [Coprinopsis cinerea okayama7\